MGLFSYTSYKGDRPLYECNGCITPKYPTVLGPTRRCMLARTLRSMMVMKATDSRTGTSTITTSSRLYRAESIMAKGGTIKKLCT